MRRILLIVAMLLIATPALATVTVNAVYKDPSHTGTGVVEVNYVYTGTGVEAVRAFALDISVTGGLTIDAIRDFNVGDNNGYGIFPGKFRERIDAANPNWADPCYNPVAPALDPGAQGGLTTSAITIEMGSLYVGSAPPDSGRLCTLDVNSHLNAVGQLSMAVNSNRGGVVLENGSSVAPVLNGTEVRFVYAPAAPTITYPVADYNSYYTVSWSAPAGATSYQLDVCSPGGNWGSIYTGANTLLAEGPKAVGLYRYRVEASNTGGTGPWGYGISGSTVNDINVQKPKVALLLYPKWDSDTNVPILWDAPECNAFEVNYSADGGGGGTWLSLYKGPNKSYGQLKLAPGLYRYRVRGSNSFGTTDWNAPNYDCNVYMSTCYANGNSLDPGWNQWTSVGRPDCWCKATTSTANDPNGSGYQCDGDADGATGGANYRVYTGDQAMIGLHWKKTAAQITSDPNVTLAAGKLKIQAACADIDHKTGGANYRVYTADQSIIGANWKKLGSSTVTATNRLPGNCPR